MFPGEGRICYGPIFEAHVHCTAITGFKDEPRMYPNECILVRLKVFFEAHVEYRLQMKRLKVFLGPYIYLKPVLYIFFEAHICVSKNMLSTVQASDAGEEVESNLEVMAVAGSSPVTVGR